MTDVKGERPASQLTGCGPLAKSRIVGHSEVTETRLD